MADIEKTISIIFNGEDRVSQVVTSISGKLNQFDAVAGAIADPFAKVADGVLAADAALAALALGGLAYAYTKSVSFEAALIDLEKVIGDQPEALAAAKKAAFDLSSQYGASSTEILASIANFKQAGFDVEEAMLLTKNSLDLMIAGELEANEASNLLVATLKGFNAPASEAGRLVDILNAVSNEYATNVEELARGMAGISPIASQMNFSFEETAALLVPVIEVFRSGDEAAVALKTGLLKLVDDAKPVREALASIGVTQTDANGKLRSGKDILFDVARAFQGLEENQKLFITSQLVGIEQSARMVKVFDDLAKNTAITQTALNAAGSASEEVAKRLASAEVVINRFATGFENLAITVGDQFRVATTEAIAGGTEIENVLRQMVDAGTFAPVFELINAFADDLGALLRQVAKELPEAFELVDFEPLLKALRNVGAEIVSYFDGLDLSTPEGLAQAIQGVIDAVSALINVTAGMAEGFKPVWAAIVETINYFKDMDSASQSQMGTLLALAKVVQTFGATFSTVIIALGENADVLQRILTGVDGSIRLVWNSFQMAFRAIELAITEAVIAIAKGIDMISFGQIEGMDRTIADLELFSIELKSAMIQDAFDAEVGLKKIGEATAIFGEEAREAAEKTQGLGKEVASLPAEKEITYSINSLDEVRANLAEIGVDVASIPDDVLIKVYPDLAKTDVANVQKELDQAIPEVRELEVVALEDGAKTIRNIGEVIDREIPEKKVLEIEADEVKIARIKDAGETLRASFEWRAKLDIAQLEADARVAEKIAETLGESFNNTGDVLSELWGTFSDLDTFEQGDLLRQLDRENERRDALLEEQKKLNEAQLKLMEARAQAINSGQGLVTITSDGTLAPELEALFMEVLRRVQVAVAEQQADFLLGLGV